MNEYHKIHSVFKRDRETNKFTPEFTCPEFEYLADKEWLWTEKIDGTNVRIMWDGENIRYGGRTDRANIPVKLLDALNALFLNKKEVFISKFGTTPVCLYGEGYGAGIQKCGGGYRHDNSFILFDVLIGRWWLRRDDVCDMAETLDIDVVPLVGSGTIQEAINLVTEGFTSSVPKDGKLIAEGLVLRPAVELLDRAGRRIITKLKHRDFK